MQIQYPQARQQQAKLPTTVRLAFTPTRSYSWAYEPTSTANTQPDTQIHKLNQYQLANWGRLLAAQLANILEQLRVYDENAVHSIVSIIEQFMETTDNHELNIGIPPKAFREVTIEVTREGKVTPQIRLD